MNSAKPTFVSVTLTFVAAAVFYFIAYSYLSKKQTNKGPWRVMFTNDAQSVPEIVIYQPGLGLSNVHVRLSGETLAATQHAGLVEFKQPKTAVPFGEVIFDDLMFQPGTVTLDLFGHEVELLPRVLVLDRKQVPWTSNSTNTLQPGDKLSPEVRKESKGGYRR